MPLPEKVIEQLGRDPDKSPGWALGALLFSGGILFLAVIIYAGLTYGYEPYLNNQLTATQAKVSALTSQISPADQTQLIDFYSQIQNLQTLLQNHVLSTQFFTWLENNTEANVYYQSLSFSNENSVTLMAVAKTEADANQQIAIFENSPDEVTSVSVPSVSAPASLAAAAAGTAGWTFAATLTLNPSIFLATTTTQ